MTYAKERAVGAIHELPLRQNEAFRAFLRKSYFFNYEQVLSYQSKIFKTNFKNAQQSK